MTLQVPTRGSSNPISEDLQTELRDGKNLATSPVVKREETESEKDLLSGALRYPLDNQDRYQAYIKFSQYEIIPPTLGESAKESLEGKVSKTAKAVSEGESEYGILNFFSALREAFTGGDENTDTQSVTPNDPNATDSVITTRRVDMKGDPMTLYLPTSLVFNDGLTYDTPSLGAMGGTAMATAASGGQALATLSSSFEKGLKSVMDAALGNYENGDLARLGMTRLLSKTGAIGEGASIAAGVTLNPNVRASFKGVAIREFSFQFKFIPKSQEESLIVEKMIKRFRYAAYPESLNTDPNANFEDQTLGNIALGYKFPDLFDIKVNYVTENGEVRIGNKFQKCFLKGITTNYNPSTMAFHKDGKPVEIDLTLNFVEEKTLDRRAISEGY